MKKVYLADATLKTIGAASGLLFREKTAIVACIERFGADAVELPAITNPKEDAIVYKTFAGLLKNCRLTVPAGKDAAAAYAAIQTAKYPCLQVELPVSTVTMEYLYHQKAEKMLQTAADAVRAAADLCAAVEFSAQDATRADRDYLIKMLQMAVKNGATAVTVCDDAGIFMPQDWTDLLAALRPAITVPIYVRVSDALHMGVAAAVAAVCAGADGVKTAMTGTDYPKTADFAAVLAAKGAALELQSGLKQTELKTDVNELLESVRHDRLAPAAKAEARVLFTGECTVADVHAAAEKLGYTLSAEDDRAVYKALLGVLQKKASVETAEFEAIVATGAMQAPATYYLKSYHIATGNLATSMAHIVLTGNHMPELSGMAPGDGPIDAAFMAIEQCVGLHYELDEFSIRAVTEGHAALGSALVRLRSGGKIYSGNGLSADIVEASIRAYLVAVNKIVYEEGQA